MIRLQDTYVQAARQHGAATQEGNSKAANAAYRTMSAALAEIRRLPDGGADLLSELPTNADTSVTLWAATHLLSYRPVEASAVLQMIAEQAIPLLSLSAKITLEEWNAGRLKAP